MTISRFLVARIVIFNFLPESGNAWTFGKKIVHFKLTHKVECVRCDYFTLKFKFYIVQSSVLLLVLRSLSCNDNYMMAFTMRVVDSSSMQGKWLHAKSARSQLTVPVLLNAFPIFVILSNVKMIFKTWVMQNWSFLPFKVRYKTPGPWALFAAGNYSSFNWFLLARATSNGLIVSVHVMDCELDDGFIKGSWLSHIPHEHPGVLLILFTLYRARLKGSGQVWWIWGEKLAFSSQQQAF